MADRTRNHQDSPTVDVLPVGLCVVGPPGSDRVLLGLAVRAAS